MEDIKENIDGEVVETEIDMKKVYTFPEEIQIVKYKDVYLAIYTEGIMWLVLYDEDELSIFNDLSNKKSIEYVYNKYREDSVTNVIVQIEAKKFENPCVTEDNEENVYIYLTNNCNQRCKHCYMYAGDVIIEELEVDKWFDIIKKLKNAGCRGVTFTGGEVTVYKGYEKIIKFAHEIGLQVTVLSNGILWTKESIEELHGYIDEIQISIDGYNKESYFEVRKYDGFNKAIECIDEFCSAGTKVSMAVTPLFDKLDEFILNFEPFAKRMLNNYPQLFIKLNHELIVGREVNTTEEENKEYRTKLKALVERLYPNYYMETFVLNFENKSIRHNCGFGGVSIAANGDVYWCNRIHELKSSINVLDVDIEKILRLGKLVKENTSVENTKVCKQCEIRYICGGGCRMKYKGIKDIENHEGEWEYICDGKERLYEKMILSNEYFFEE